MTKLRLTILVSEKGLYVGNDDRNYNGQRKPISEFLVNDIAPKATFKSGWYFVPEAKQLDSIKIKQSRQPTNYRWELVDSTPDEIRKLVPETITQEESKEWYDYDRSTWSLGIHQAYQNFYVRRHDWKEGEFTDVSFKIEHEGTITESSLNTFPEKSTYTVWKSEYKHRGDRELDISAIASYEELNEMLVPDLVIHNTPCSITSKQTYDIVRRYVLDNIDKRWAHVSSDYDFCFTVKKKYEIKPYEHTWEEKKANGKSYRKPRVHRKTITRKEFTVFEMTHADRQYKGYTVIKGFRGDTLADLIEGIKHYLDDLMEVINKPLYECAHCQGSGIVNESLKK